MKALGSYGLFALLLGIFMLGAVQAHAFESKPFDQSAFEAAQGEGKPILVDVFAPWCPTCRAQQAILEKLRQNPAYDGVVVFKVDYDNQKDVVKSFAAQRQSTLIAFNGITETGRSVGDTRPDSVESLLKTTLE
jgi:thiol-disulfide isomerase/thioredoxin